MLVKIIRLFLEPYLVPEEKKPRWRRSVKLTNIKGIDQNVINSSLNSLFGEIVELKPGLFGQAPVCIFYITYKDFKIKSNFFM